MADMRLMSADFSDGDYLCNDHVLSEEYGLGCAGRNLSPQLSWSGAPVGTKSFALNCFDPDAPTVSGFWHWVVVNIPPDVTALEAGAGNPESDKLSAGALQVRTDYGLPGYGGPCPPAGAHPHRYIFTLYAVGLDELPVTSESSAAVVDIRAGRNMLAKATLMGFYKR